LGRPGPIVVQARGWVTAVYHVITCTSDFIDICVCNGVSAKRLHDPSY